MSRLVSRKFATVLLGIALLVAIAPASAVINTELKNVASAELGGRQLEQIGLTTTDLSRAKAFYREVLGLPFLFEVRTTWCFLMLAARDL